MVSGATGARVLITGGGTGGHVYPALALAEELVRRGTPPDRVRFVGARRGLEARAVPEAGFAIELLPGRGLQRRLTPANLGALWSSLVAFFRALRIVGRERPAVVVGVGGYASLACVVAARLRRIPVVVHEQNAAPGLVNRIAVRLGARPAVSLPGTRLAGAVVVGNPVREVFTRIERSPDPTRPLVLAFGGSLGARRINDAVLGLAEQWRHRPDRRIRHVAGRRNHAECVDVLSRVRRDGDPLEYTLVAYEDDMAERYGEASVVVCRAGAVTVAELAAAGVPSILVPLPGAPGDHQTRNAEALIGAGGAVMVPDDECTTDRLAAELDDLLGDPQRLEVMGRRARSLARPRAAAELADLVEEVSDAGA